MSLYAHADYRVADDIAAAHADQIPGLGAPGTWFTGAERLAMVQHARNVGIAAGVLEAPDDHDDTPAAGLPEKVRDVVETLALRPADIDQDFYDAALAGGLTDAEYVEIVGVVSRATNFDIFARGIGVDLLPLPDAQAGEPNRERPIEAVIEQAWVPTIPTGEAGGDIGKQMYHGRPVPYIGRALSLVVDENKAHAALEAVQYLPPPKVLIADYKHHEGLSRAQAEIVAARVSALNECFYWTTGHARFLRESGRKHNIEYDLGPIIGRGRDAGMPGSEQLIEFAEALLGTDRVRLDAARTVLAQTLSTVAVSGAAIMAANFSKNDRIANACGIPMHEAGLADTEDIRADLGINDYRSAINTLRHKAAA